MHTDGETQPVEKVGQRIEDLQFPHRQEGRAAKNYAEEGIREEGPHADEELCGEVFALLVDDVAGGISEAEEADVKNLQFEETAKEEVGGLVNDDAGKSESSDDRARNKKHEIGLLLGGRLAATEKLVVLLLRYDPARIEPVLNARSIFFKRFESFLVALR